MVKTKPKHKALRRYCFKCKRVHSVSDHKHHGKGAFKKVRSPKSYKAAMKPKTKKRKPKKFSTAKKRRRNW